MRMVTIVLPSGYESPEAFVKDCGFELALPKIAQTWVEQEAPLIIDLLRDIAGLQDAPLSISMHNVLLQAVLEWRAEARRILDAS